MGKGGGCARRAARAAGGMSGVKTQGLRELPAVGNGDLLARLAVFGAAALHGLHHVHPLLDAAEDDVLAVQPLGLGSADEELGAVRVGAGVGHGQDAGPCVLQDEVLVGKLLPVNGFATSAVVARKVTTLTHEAGDDPVEAGALVAKSLLAGAQSTEVLCCYGHLVSEELEGDAAQGLAVGGDVEEHDGVGHGGAGDGERLGGVLAARRGLAGSAGW